MPFADADRSHMHSLSFSDWIENATTFFNIVFFAAADGPFCLLACLLTSYFSCQHEELCVCDSVEVYLFVCLFI